MFIILTDTRLFLDLPDPPKSIEEQFDSVNSWATDTTYINYRSKHVLRIHTQNSIEDFRWVDNTWQRKIWFKDLTNPPYYFSFKWVNII